MKRAKFNKWTVLREAKTNRRGTWYVCKCDCGTVREVVAWSVRGGYSKSCGCSRTTGKMTHGYCSRTQPVPEKKRRLYRVWSSMVSRAKREEIPISRKWATSFEAFEQDMGACPAGRMLGRVKLTKGYFPGNCKWVTRREFANNKSTTRRLTYRGKTQSLSQWARELKLNASTIQDRLANGWSIKEALTA